MVNEEKVLLMTKMASYEEQTGKKDKAVAGYFKRDYVGMQMLWSFVYLTIAFFACIGTYLVLNFEEVMGQVYTMDLAATGRKLLWAYLGALAIYETVTYAVYSVRYIRARKRLNLLFKYLEELDEKPEEKLHAERNVL